VLPGSTGNDAATKIYSELEPLKNTLPFGYSIDIGGALERSNKGSSQVLKIVPFMLILIVVLLMFQLQNIKRIVITLLTAQLGIIGVSPALLLFNTRRNPLTGCQLLSFRVGSWTLCETTIIDNSQVSFAEY